MPGLNHAVNSYANTVATLRNGFLIALAVILVAAAVIWWKKNNQQK